MLRESYGRLGEKKPSLREGNEYFTEEKKTVTACVCVCSVEESVGSEDCVLGCAAFCHLPAQRGLASAAAVQLSLLAVRRKCRRSGMGRHLMQVGIHTSLWITIIYFSSIKIHSNNTTFLIRTIHFD